MDTPRANRLLDEMTDLVNEIRYCVNYPDGKRRDLALRNLIERARLLLEQTGASVTIDLSEEPTRR